MCIRDRSTASRTDDGKPAGYTKFWSQDSPTTPCAPYHIDCINPLRVSEEHIRRLIITEGGKDVLTLNAVSYTHLDVYKRQLQILLKKRWETLIY